MDGDGPRAKAEEGADLTRSAGRGGGGTDNSEAGFLDKRPHNADLS